jgi:hypothetical protein
MRPLRQTSGRPPEEINKGKSTKPIPELEQLDSKLSKIEIKTDKMIEKSKSIEARIKTKALLKLSKNTPQSLLTLPLNSTEPLPTIRGVESFHDFLSMTSRKLPRQVLNYVRDHAYSFGDEWFSAIDSFDFSEKIGKSCHQLADVVAKLRDERWFEVIKFSTSGSRTLKINPKAYGLSR